jgi:hypothetical protein
VSNDDMVPVEVVTFYPRRIERQKPFLLSDRPLQARKRAEFVGLQAVQHTVQPTLAPL